MFSYVCRKWCVDQDTAIFELNSISEAPVSFIIIAPRSDLKIAVGHTAISIKIQLIVQP